MFKYQLLSASLGQIECWWYPPQPPTLKPGCPPNPEDCFMQKVFCWFPRKMWRYQFLCPACNNILTGKGWYQKVREVTDISGRYMITEALECNKCHLTFSGWSPEILDKLDLRKRIIVPCGNFKVCSV